MIRWPGHHPVAGTPFALAPDLPCKCCNANAPWIGTVDFNKSCEDRRQPRPFPVSQERVPYHRCRNCGFIFTPYCDTWSPGDFRRRIYNDDYDKADQDPGSALGVEHTVSYQWGLWFASVLDGTQDSIRLLDFGAGGNPGRAGQALIDRGFRVTSYEPFRAEAAAYVQGRFDVIYAMEVLEHCTDVGQAVRFIADHLADRGVVYFSTLLHPHPSGDDVLESWYIAPRNGHVSIFTLPAITILFRQVGLNVVQTVHGFCAVRNPTGFASQLFV